MGQKQQQISRTRTRRSPQTPDDAHTPDTGRPEIRKDIRRVWFPDA